MADKWNKRYNNEYGIFDEQVLISENSNDGIIDDFFIFLRNLIQSKHDILFMVITISILLFESGGLEVTAAGLRFTLVGPYISEVTANVNRYLPVCVVCHYPATSAIIYCLTFELSR
jgi:hypothetical protein